MLWYRLCLILFVCLVLMPSSFASTSQVPNDAFVAMADAGAAYLNDSSQSPGVISAASVQANLEFYTVIDIRSFSAYENGHIPGAFNSSLGTIVDDLATFIPSDKPYIIAGYSGLVSGHAKIAMELLGYSDVYSLLYGMSAWNSNLDVWTNNCADNLYNPETENQNPNLVVHDYPNLPGDPETIVQDRVELMLNSGYRGISYASLEENLDQYFIINYFGEADYLGAGTSGVPGHIPGSFQFTPYVSLGLGQMLDNIPTDMPVVVYGWTGMFSSQVVAYLNMLGYDAYSLNFGANNLFHSSLLAHFWSPAVMNDFPLEVGPGPSAVPHAEPSLLSALGNHPNPFNPVTTISYILNEPARVSLKIYDLGGRLVRDLIQGADQSQGWHEFTWQGNNEAGLAVASGVYLCRVDADGQSESKLLLLVK